MQLQSIQVGSSINVCFLASLSLVFSLLCGANQEKIFTFKWVIMPNQMSQRICYHTELRSGCLIELTIDHCKSIASRMK